jgi:hypothetical protein
MVSFNLPFMPVDRWGDRWEILSWRAKVNFFGFGQSKIALSELGKVILFVSISSKYDHLTSIHTLDLKGI